MKIILAHRSYSTNSKIPWIYFGNSYLKMKECENKLDGKRINLQDEIHDQAKFQKKPFLEWIESQRTFNKDSIHWWMTQIAGRNNAYSSFFVNLCQLFAIKHYLEKNDQSDILIVCEDIFLFKLISCNLSTKTVLQSSLFLKFYWFKDISFLITKGLLNQFKLFCILIIHYFYAKITKPKKINKPSGHVNVFHHCLSDENTFKEDSLTCIYFTILPSWLKKKGQTVFGLPWFFKLKPSISFYKKLRKVDVLIPEDWLSLVDYFNIYKNSIKAYKTLSNKNLYPNAKINYLIFHEKLSQLGEHSIIFWRYIPAIQKWSNKLKSLTVYDQYQNMMFEHPLRYIIKKLPIKSTSIGYYHSLVSKEFMTYQHLQSEWESQMKPDFIVCSGKIGENLLLEQGVPRNKIISAAALRQSISDIEQTQKKPSKNLLILLSLVPESSLETLMKLYNNSLIITNNLKLKVKVKIHPMMKVDYILKKIKWKRLPQGWEWTKKDLYSELDESYCCIAMDTAAVFDAIVKGNIVISLKSDLNLMENYLDFFSSKYALTKSVSEQELGDKIQDIFVSKAHQYQVEFSQIRKEIFEGINPINSKNLDNFLIQ